MTIINYNNYNKHFITNKKNCQNLKGNYLKYNKVML